MKYTKIEFNWGPSEDNKLLLTLDPLNVSSPYVIKSISGLEPPPVNIAIAKKQGGGGVYQGRSPENRQIVLTLGFQPNHHFGITIGDLRAIFYRMITPRLKGVLTITLYNDAMDDWLRTTGYISNIETNPFSKDPELQVTVDCLSPYLDKGVYVHPNPSCYDKMPLVDIRNEGQAPTGFHMRVVLTGPTSFFRFFTEDSLNWIHITYPFLSGDIIDINTYEGDRSMTLTRGATKTNLIKSLSPNTSWLQLDGGYNRLIPNIITYQITELNFIPRFWGI